MIKGLNYMKEYAKIISKLSFRDFLSIIDAYGKAILFDIDKLPKESDTGMTQSDYLNRLHSCQVCPVRNGWVCDPTRKRAHKFEDRVVSGCGCGILASQRKPNKPCPAGEWKVFNTQQ